MLYFSEREAGERPRDNDEISQDVWGGVRVLIYTGIHNGSFGNSYPESCPDGPSITGTDGDALWQAMRAEIPALREPPLSFEPEPWMSHARTPPILTMLDIIEFCWRRIGKPIHLHYHDYLNHYHLTFSVEAGQEEFREAVNRIFRCNGIAYDLKEDGHIERFVPSVLSEELLSAHFSTSDSKLNCMLESARRKFLDNNEVTRREALNVLWDAWERLKTLGSGSDKKAQSTALLDATAGPSSPMFREALEQEALALTKIGNNLHIRHSETGQEQIANNKHVDYLFHRLFALVLVILRMTH